MYGRTVDGEPLTFGHEGVLYRNSFVMYDRGTRSLWVHTTGQAVKGPLRGASLEFVPSEVVPWSDWRARHPETLVLDRGGEGTGFMGTFSLPDRAEEFGYSVGGGVEATLYPHDLVVDAGLVQRDDHVVVHVEDADAVRAYERAGRSFELDGFGYLTDGDGSTWDPLTGMPLDGSAQPLVRLPATAWLIDRWKSFYADGAVVSEEP